MRVAILKRRRAPHEVLLEGLFYMPRITVTLVTYCSVPVHHQPHGVFGHQHHGVRLPSIDDQMRDVHSHWALEVFF